MMDYEKIPEKIEDLEDELKRTRMELECSKKSELKKEVENYLDQCILRNEDLQEELEFIKNKISSLLEPEKGVEDYSLANAYFTSFKERYTTFDDIRSEERKARANLLSFLSMVKAS